jgi:hypothetical protein
MKILVAPDGIMVWETAIKPNENFYLNSSEIVELIKWLDNTRPGFVEAALAHSHIKQEGERG